MTVTDIISKYDDKTAALTMHVRDFILKQVDGMMEIPDQSANIIGYGFGTGYKDMIWTILLSKKGVKLAFYKGSELPDPSKLLTGTGKVHRYVEINSAKDLENPALKGLMKQALKAYETRKK